MADRTVKITLTAVTHGLVAGLKTAQKATKDYGTSLAAQAKANRAEWESAGRALTGFGAATVGGLALATRAAMSWESAWAGVLKTVDGSADQLERLEGDLREMARTLPASHTEIAAVAEAAGQLGVHVDDVAEFTRTMIDLGETTNLSAEEAATSLARFTNIMGTSQDKVSNLGASVVGLGNNFATTEGEIVALSMRLAGAGKQAELSEGEVLGLAAAMSSVGIEAEAGGTAMSLTMKRITREVELGGDKLGMFAEVAGMSAEQFSQAWGQDAAGTLEAFIAGLAETESMGMSTTAVLTELGVTGIRESDALLRLSAASGVLSDALAMGNEEFEKNTALILEAAKRYETAESRIKAAGNALNDVAIDIGALILPAVADLAGSVADVAAWFQNLPEPVKAAATGLAGAAGAASLAAGSFLLVFPRVMDTVSAFRELQKLNPRIASGLGKVGKAAGALAAAFALGHAVRSLVHLARGVESVDGSVEALVNRLLTGGTDALGGFTVALGDLAEAGQIAEHRFGSLGDAVSAVANQNWADRFFGGLGLDADGISDVTKRFQDMGTALSTIAASDLPRAQAEFKKLWLEAGGNAQAGADLLDIMPEYRTHLTGLATDAKMAATDATLLRLATGDLAAGTADATDETRAQDRALDRLADGYRTGTATAEEYAGALRELVDLKREASGVVLSERDAQRRYQDALKASRDALEENGKTLDITKEKGRQNQSALDEIAKSGWDLVEAMEANGASQKDMQAVLEQTREDFVKMARRMGMSKDEAKALADQLGLFPENIDVAIAVETDTAKRNIDKFITDNDGRRIRVSVDTVQGTTFRYSPTGPVARAGGGKIPGPPSSTDNVLAHLATGEWVINARSSQKYDSLLAAINADALPGYATGGRVGEDEKRRIREERERRRRLRELEREVKTEIRRGSIRSSVTSGLSGAYSVVDDLRDLSRNTDLSKGRRKRLADTARESEKALEKLYKRSEKIENRLAKARDRVAELGQIAGQVSDRLRGEQSLADSIVRGTTTTDSLGRQSTTADTVSSRSLVSAARAKAAKIRAFAGKLQKLQQMGLSGTVLQEIAMLGSEEGSLVADAMIAGGKSDINALNKAYADIAKWSDQAGQYVTEGFYKGGLSAAAGLVKGLEDQQAAIEKQMVKIAKSMEKALKRALGIKSPSTVLRGLMHQVGRGAELGLEDSVDGVAQKADKLGLAAIPSLDSAGSSAPLVVGAASGRAMTDADIAALASAMAQVKLPVHVGRSESAAITRIGFQEVKRTDPAVLR